jgi:ribonuclease BN (tRNA processing enzyme)
VGSDYDNLNLNLTLTVLGSSGSYPGPGQACSGYLVRSGGTTVWLDAGTGTLANLQYHVTLADVDAIVLSHQHPDHWSDMDHFYVACKYVIERQDVPVYAPAGLKTLLRTGTPTEPVFRWHDIGDGDTVEIGPMRWSFSRTDHPPETLAARVDAGARSFGYSADSGPAWSLEALGPGLHLALCEATYLNDREGSAPHMSARQAGATARAAGAERLLLTHLWPTIDHAAARRESEVAFGRPVELATINQTYVI